MDQHDGMTFDLQAAIRTRQERRALAEALAFSRHGLSQFREAPGTMVGTHDLNIRILAAIEAGMEQYTDVPSTLAAAFNNIAGVMGYAIASLPESYGAHIPGFWNEVGKRALKTYQACVTAVAADRDAAEKKTAEKGTQ